MVIRRIEERRLLLLAGLTAELTLLSLALVVSLAAGSALTSGIINLIAATVAIAMGIQNAVSRRIAVPDLTTTVVTLTLTGLVANRRGATAPGAMTRRVLSVAAMLAGAGVGATIVLNSGPSSALAIAVGLLAAATVLAIGTARPPA